MVAPARISSARTSVAERFRTGAGPAAASTGRRAEKRRAGSTVSRYSSRLGPLNHGVRSLRVITLSPCSALSGIACARAPARIDFIITLCDSPAGERFAEAVRRHMPWGLTLGAAVALILLSFAAETPAPLAAE